MKFPPPAFICLAAVTTLSSWGWLGVKSRARPPREAAAPIVPSVTAPAKASADTVSLSRKIMTIPAGSPGKYLGTLGGVRCFNCTPGIVLLNLGDSVSSEAAILALPIEVWNAIERPLKDRRLFDYGNRCFYFGYKERDTAFVGGEWTEIRVQDMPCFPYLKRTLRNSLASRPVPGEPQSQAMPSMAPQAPAPQSPPADADPARAAEGYSAEAGADQSALHTEE